MFQKFLLSLMVAVMPAMVVAQSAPKEPVTIVVGFGAGGFNDKVARIIADKLTTKWGVPVRVENRPGAAGTLAGGQVAQAASDGTTLMLTTVTTHAMAPTAMSPRPYDPVKDFTHISYLGQVDLVVAVRKDLPVNSFKELLAYGQTNKLTYGSSGVASAENYGGELVKKVTGLTSTHVPYKGGSALRADLLGGHIDMTFGWYSSTIEHINKGNLRALAVLSDKRLPGLPDVPTLKELGYDVSLAAWYGLAGPKGMDPKQAEFINREIQTVLAMTDVREMVSKSNGDLSDGALSPRKFTEFVKSENTRMKDLSEKADIRITQ